jgi:hypothetical protein
MFSDIVFFQSGNFNNGDPSIWNDLLINIVGALIGTGTALIIFSLQIKYEKEKTRKDDLKFQKQKIHYFASLVKSILKLSKKQYPEILNFCTKLKENPLEIPLLTIYPTNDFKRFSEDLNHADYYHAYLSTIGYTDDTVEEFRKFYATVDYLNSQSNQMGEMIKNGMQYDYERKVDYKKIVEKVMEDAAIYFNNAKNNTIDNLASFLNQSLIQFYEGDFDHSNLLNFQEKFVDPVKIVLINDFRHIDKAMILANNLKNATYIFTHIKFSNKNLAEEFEVVYTNYKSTVDNFEIFSLNVLKKFKLNE